MDCILSGLSIDKIVPLIHNLVLMSESEGCKLRIDDGDEEGEDLVDSIFASYKGP